MDNDKRFLRLVTAADRGRNLAHLVNTREVEQFFRDYERECLDMIVDANADDDGVRREAGLRLKAMRTFERELKSAVETGKRAQKKVEVLRNE